MVEINEIPACSHCGKRMSKWAAPQLPFGGSTTWACEFLYVCFNDECPYFVKGWDWMWNHYQRRVSYRHTLDPSTGQTSPIPVPTGEHLRECIIEE